MSTRTVLRNPAHLRMHSLRKLLPIPSKQRVDAIATAIANKVKLPPIYIVEDGKPEGGLVVAGWTRTLAHKQMQQDVECIVVTEDEADAIALGENTNRQMYRFGYQVAWIYMPLAEYVIEHAKKRKLANLRHANLLESAATALSTMEEVAERIGVSRRLMFDVKSAYDTIKRWDSENDPKCWNGEKQKRTALEHASLRILDEEDPCTPGNIVAGLAGKKAGEDGRTHPKPKQLDLFLDGLASVRKWGQKFNSFEGDAHRKAVAAVKETVAAWPKELREEVLSEIKRLNREQKEAL